MTPEAVDRAIDAILVREGSTFTDDPTDPGGPTKYGITLHTLRVWRNDHTLKAPNVEILTEKEARTIYKLRYVFQPGFHRISNDQIAAFLVDTGVLHGQSRAIRMLQEALGVGVDGVIGPQTLAGISRSVPASLLTALGWKRIDREVQQALASARKRFGASEVNKTKLKYLRGWLRRTYDQV